MGGTTLQRIKLMAAALLTLAGISTFPSDMRSFLTDIGEAGGNNPGGLFLVGLGLALAVYALWDEILDLFDVQSTPRIGKTVRDLLHMKHGWALDQSEIAGDHFRIVAVYNKRPLTFIKAKGENVLVIGAGIRPDDQARKIINAASDDARANVTDDLISALALIDNLQMQLETNLERIAISINVESINRLDEFRLFEGISAIMRGYAVIEASLRRWARSLERTQGEPPSTIAALPPSNSED